MLQPPPDHQEPGCNCNSRVDCPLNGSCLIPSITYSATVTTGVRERIYYGSVKGSFKTRYYGHTHSFRQRSKRATELSKLALELKDSGTPHSIRWNVIAKAHPYVGGYRKCDLCLTEKLVIARSKHPGIINSRSEIVSKCRHMNKFLLNSIHN